MATSLPIDLKISRLFSTKSLSKIHALFSEYSLWTLYEAAHIQKNKSMYLPYHNTYHALCMVKDCAEGAQFAELSYEQTRNLLIAALCHDLNHSGGATPDAENIKIACQDVEALHAEGFLTAKEAQSAIEIIKVTQYPYTALSLDSEEKRIIRDADLCAMLGDSWIDHVVVGLQAELAVAGITIPPTELRDKYWKFYSESERHSQWGKAMHDEHMQAIYHKLYLIDIALNYN